jgi:hypothetical protein
MQENAKLVMYNYGELMKVEARRDLLKKVIDRIIELHKEYHILDSIKTETDLSDLKECLTNELKELSE